MTAIYTTAAGKRIEMQIVANDGEFIGLAVEPLGQIQFWIRRDSQYIEIKETPCKP